MSNRLTLQKIPAPVMQSMLAIERFLAAGQLEARLRHLVKLRVSQINGCAYCVEMHRKEAERDGESARRLAGLVVWRESPDFEPRERAALDFAEALTTGGGVNDAIYGRVSEAYSESELAELTAMVMAITAWNRWNVAMQTPPEA